MIDRPNVCLFSSNTEREREREIERIERKNKKRIFQYDKHAYYIKCKPSVIYTLWGESRLVLALLVDRGQKERFA